MGVQDSQDQFNPTGPVDIAGSGLQPKGEHATAMEELQAEMKLLNWHKLANEAALKAALLRTKSLRDTETKMGAQSGNIGSPANSLQEKAAWMAQVIEEEQRKPLQVSKDFVSAYAASEERASERLDMEVERHIEVLRKLRVRVGERDEQKQRKARYKEAVQDLKVERSQIAAGKPLASNSSVQNAGLHPKSTLTTVINSLDKLVELERRITGLENDSLYDRIGNVAAHPHVAAVHAAEAVPSVLGPKQGSELRFTKGLTAASHAAPSKTSYSVRVVPKQRGHRVFGGNASASGQKPGAALAALKGRGSQGKGGRAAPRAASVSAPLLNTGRSVSRVPGRATNTGSYNRVLHQDAAINGWLQQKKAPGRSLVKNVKVGNAGRGGRGGERQAGPRSMQQFQDLRGQIDKRKDEMRRRLKQGGSSSAPSGTQGGSGTGLPLIGRGKTSSAGPMRTRGSSVTRLPKLEASNQQRAVRRAW